MKQDSARRQPKLWKSAPPWPKTRPGSVAGIMRWAGEIAAQRAEVSALISQFLGHNSSLISQIWGHVEAFSNHFDPVANLPKALVMQKTSVSLTYR